MWTDNKRYKLIEACYVDVERYLRKFGLSEEDYNDAVQQTFVEAFSQAHRLRDESKVRNWIIKIARTQGLRCKKKGFLYAMDGSYDEEVVQLDSIDQFQEDVLGELVTKADNLMLIAGMKTLKEKEQITLILQYIYEEKLQDIAQIIGESLTNTKTISRRAKEKLKNFLIEGGYENGK